MNESGLCLLNDEPVSAELPGNQTGRVARTRPGLATFLDDVDDTEQALLQLPKVTRPPAREIATFLLGPPSRLYYVLHTCAHLVSHGFPDVRWLRTPETHELGVYTTSANAKVMTFSYTTVLPALRLMDMHHGVKKVFVCEDTCIMTPGATFDIVNLATVRSPGSTFGYGTYVATEDTILWLGLKDFVSQRSGGTRCP